MTLASIKACDCALQKTNDGRNKGRAVFTSARLCRRFAAPIDNCDNAKQPMQNQDFLCQLTNMIENGRKLTSTLIILLLLIAVVVIELPQQRMECRVEVI